MLKVPTFTSDRSDTKNAKYCLAMRNSRIEVFLPTPLWLSCKGVSTLRGTWLVPFSGFDVFFVKIILFYKKMCYLAAKKRHFSKFEFLTRNFHKTQPTAREKHLKNLVAITITVAEKKREICCTWLMPHPVCSIICKSLNSDKTKVFCVFNI